MYAMIIAVALGNLQTIQQIEPGDWIYKNQKQFMQLNMKEFGRFSNLKTVSFMHSRAGKDLSGRPYFGVRQMTGFYSVEKKGEEVLIHCRFTRLNEIFENMGKDSGKQKVDYIVTFHTKLTSTGKLEVYYTSDGVKNLIGWPVNRKYLFQNNKKRLNSK